MSNANPMEQAGGQAAQAAAVALQVLILTARALSEASRREVPQPANRAPVQPAQEAERQPADADHERYAHLVRGTVQPSTVAEVMVNASQWPQVADELKRLERAGVNVGQFLRDAAPLISRMDADLRAGSATPGVTTSPSAVLPRDPWAPPGQVRDRPNAIQRAGQWVKDGVSELWEKVTQREGKTSALGERSQALARLGISGQENARLVVVARESFANESMLGQMVTSREWPGIANQLKALQEARHNPREALAGVPLRIQQAASAGITLTPSEAARGLLADMSKTPSPAPRPASSLAAGTPPRHTTPAAPASTPPTAAAPAPTAPTHAAPAPAAQTPAAQTPAAARAAAASAQSTTATEGKSLPGPKAAPASPAAAAPPTRTHGR